MCYGGRGLALGRGKPLLKGTARTREGSFLRGFRVQACLLRVCSSSTMSALSALSCRRLVLSTTRAGGINNRGAVFALHISRPPSQVSAWNGSASSSAAVRGCRNLRKCFFSFLSPLWSAAASLVAIRPPWMSKPPRSSSTIYSRSSLPASLSFLPPLHLLCLLLCCAGGDCAARVCPEACWPSRTYQNVEPFC